MNFYAMFVKRENDEEARIWLVAIYDDKEKAITHASLANRDRLSLENFNKQVWKDINEGGYNDDFLKVSIHPFPVPWIKGPLIEVTGEPQPIDFILEAQS